jgi:hypothetical protein
MYSSKKRFPLAIFVEDFASRRPVISRLKAIVGFSGVADVDDLVTFVPPFGVGVGLGLDPVGN